MKKFFLIAIGLLVSSLAFADVWNGSASTWVNGDGSQSNPYRIENAEHLSYLAEMVVGGINTYEGKYFLLTDDIDLNSKQWTPIGSESHPFRGVFDGGNHKITGLYVNTSDRAGLFGTTKNATLQNLSVYGYVYDGKYSSGLVAVSDGGVLQNCHNYVAISNSATYSGGIVAYNTGDLIVEGCTNNAELTITTNNSDTQKSLGGIIGYSSGKLMVSHCSNKNALKHYCNYFVKYYYVGGIVGSLTSSNSTITNSNNIGEIHTIKEGNYSYSISIYSSGIVGYTSSDCSYDKCFNRGNIKTSASIYYGTSHSHRPNICHGGIGVGGTASNCYNVGSFELIPTSLGSFSEGEVSNIVYYVYGVGSSSHSCYNSGSVTNPNNIAGNKYGTSVTNDNSYYLQGVGFSSGGIAKSEAIMKSPAMVQLLNRDSTVFVLDVTPNSNSGYPIIEELCNISAWPAHAVGFDSAIISATYRKNTRWSGGDADVMGFEYKKTTESEWHTLYVNVSDTIEHTLKNLQSDTNYIFRAFVQKDGSTFYSQDVSFTTLSCVSTLSLAVSANKNTICIGDTSTISVVPSSQYSDSFNYLWNTGDTTACIHKTTAGIYTVVVTDVNGCQASDSTTIVVNELPNGSFSGTTEICPNSTTKITASGANTYRWSTGATTPTLTTSTPGIYSCVFTNNKGCSSTKQITLTAFTKPIVSGTTEICSGEQTQLIATGTDSYQWNNGAKTSVITVTEAGTYTATGRNASGCQASVSVTVTVNSLPDVRISGNTAFCQGDSTILYATGAQSYKWFNESTESSIMVNAAGTYTLLGTSSKGCKKATSVTVSVNPVYSNVPVVASICQDDSYFLFSNQKTATGIYNGSGYSSKGCDSSVVLNLTVHPLPEVVINGEISICKGEQTRLSAVGGGSYVWNTGSTASYIDVTAGGRYTVEATDSRGCKNKAVLDLIVMELPNANITGTLTYCAGNSTTLTASGGASYRWNDNITTAQRPASSEGLYSVEVTGTNGCSVTKSVTVTELDNPNVGIFKDKNLCIGSSLMLTASGANNYLWSNGETSASIEISETGTYSVQGVGANGCTARHSIDVVAYPTYQYVPISKSICEGEVYNFYGRNITTGGTYNKTVSTTAGCDSTIELSLTVNAKPIVTVTGNTSFCEGESTTLRVSGGVSYQWNDYATSAEKNIQTAGVYTVEATASNGCKTSKSISIQELRKPQINMYKSKNLCTGATTTLSASGASSYSWSNGATGTSIEVSEAGLYEVQGVAANGCVASNSITITSYPSYSYVPVSKSICKGDIYNFYGRNIITEGTYNKGLYTKAGCDSVIVLSLVVNSKPTVSINGNVEICEGETTVLSATGGDSYTWNNGSTAASINVQTGGSYYVTAYNAQGCSTSVSKWVTVNQLPTVTISGKSSLCEGDQTTLRASGADRYEWSNGSTESSINVTNFGVYEVIGYSAYGCANTATKIVNVNPRPTISIVGDTSICQGSVTTLTAMGGTSYIWFNGQSGSKYVAGETGEYWVIGYNSMGCYRQATHKVEVHNNSSNTITETAQNKYVWNGQTYNTSGLYTQVFQNQYGCDSIVMLNLTIQTPTNGIASVLPYRITVLQGKHGIRIENAEGVNVYVFNAVGQLMYQGSYKSDIEMKHAGVYLVKIDKWPAQKIVVP